MKNLLFLVLLLSACDTSKQVSVVQTLTPLPPSVEVAVLGSGQKVPDNSKLLGTVKIGDGWTKAKDCTYDKVIADAQSQARGMGGNLIQIIEKKDPSIVSSCYRIKADVYYLK